MARPKASFPFFVEGMGKLFRTDQEMAEDSIRLTVNKRMRLTKYFLLIPYEVKGRTFRTTFRRMISCWLFNVVFFVILVRMLAKSRKKNPDGFSFLFLCPLVASFASLVVNQIWIHYRKDHLDSFLSSLQKCRPYLQVEDRRGTLVSLLFIGIQFLCFLCQAYTLLILVPERDLVMLVLPTCHHFGMFLNVALLEQFHQMLSVLCRQLTSSPPTSDVDQDALAEAASSLNVVFSPHLLIIITTICFTLLSTIFRLFTKSPFMLHDIVTFSLQCLAIWRIVSVCQRFTNQMDKFYNKIYYYALNLQDPKLQKRFELHLRMREKFVFTAGGVFEIDYTLIHSIVAACTTYFIVLVQFSKDSQILEPFTTTTATTHFS